MNFFADLIQGPMQVLLISGVLGGIALICVILFRKSGLRRYANDDRRKSKPVNKFPIYDVNQNPIMQDRRESPDRRQSLLVTGKLPVASIKKLCCQND